jgi:hypothetical protein
MYKLYILNGGKLVCKFLEEYDALDFLYSEEG